MSGKETKKPETTELTRKPLRWLAGAIKTPPFSKEARIEAGRFLGSLQDGQLLSMPHSRPMPAIGPRCHELRVRDEKCNWRIMYRIDADAIVIVEVLAKTTQTTPQAVLTLCRKRLKTYDDAKN
jgi:phage-related protein